MPGPMVAAAGCVWRLTRGGMQMQVRWFAYAHLIAVWTLGNAGGADPARRVKPLEPPAQAKAVTAPLGPVARGLVTYLSFDRHLVSFDPFGREVTATFGRDSIAFLPDLTEVDKNIPRYQPGKFGTGLLMEYGYRPAGYNQFSPAIADATVSLQAFEALEKTHIEQTVGLKGRPALKIIGEETGSGFATRPVVTPTTNRATFSFYVQGKEGTNLTLLARKQNADTPLGRTQLELTGRWQRAWLDFPLADERVPGHLTGPESDPIVFAVTTDAPQAFLAQAFMLDLGFGYAGARGVATWMPAQTARAAEILSLPPPANSQSGTFSLWANFTNTVYWRTLLAIGNTGWYPNIRVDLYDQRRLKVQLAQVLGEKQPRGGQMTLPEPLALGTWHHFVLTWDGPQVVLHLNGVAALTVDKAPERPQCLGNITVGGLPVHPATRIEGIVDEFAQWDRALSADEVAELYARPHALSDGLDIRLTTSDREPIGVFSRDRWNRHWHTSVANRDAQPLRGARLTYGVEGLFEKTVELEELPAASEAEVKLPWRPCWLRPGSYTMKLSLQAGAMLRETSRPIEIAPARVPLDNAQVINWGGVGKEFSEAGVTAGGLAGDEKGPALYQLEECVRNGMYGQYRAHLVGRAETDADRFWDPTGTPTSDDQASPGPRADAEARAARLAARLALLPDVRYLIENTEHQWIWAPDFRPRTIAYVKKRFGLDLTRWQGENIKDNNSVAHPYGRLIHGVGNYRAPESGVVSLTDPFYAYSRWWQSGEVGNEIFLNEMIAGKVRKAAPWVHCIWEPALRRPAVRVFEHQDILEEWYYFPNPLAAVWTQEALAAATRGTRQRSTGMPQFLFKPGMAAPYGGMPTPDMWRETVWLCMSRPIVGMTYWNLWGALAKQAGMHTQEEIDAVLGPEPTWEQAKDKVTATSEQSSLFLWIPELKEEIARLHHEDLHPLGALLPRWENRPRQIAVYRSFAGQMFNNIRWPGGGPLNTVLDRLGQPFDILYDQDFEENPRLLDNYKVVLAPQNTVITEPAAGQLKAFLAREGKLVVDDHFKAELPGVVQVEFQGAQKDITALQDREQTLLAEGVEPGSPTYIEAMNQASKALVAEGGPVARTIDMVREALDPEVVTASSHVCLNCLRAGGANYVAAVNDLRVPGKHYGHFGTLDKGVPQTVDLCMAPALGTFAYALPQGEAVPLKRQNGWLVARVDLPAGGGRVLVLLPEPIGKLTLSLANGTEPGRGSMVTLKARLLAQSGKAVPGVIPLRLTVTLPDGRMSDFSHYGAFIEGTWNLELPVELNALPGTYRAEVTDLASGQKQFVEWKVRESAAAPSQTRQAEGGLLIQQKGKRAL